MIRKAGWSFRDGNMRRRELAREAPMNRFKDYLSFVIWFAGIGTIVLWLLTSSRFGGALFGASMFCRADAFMPLGWLCLSAHPLSPALKGVGAMAALITLVRLVMMAINRVRRVPVVATPSTTAASPAETTLSQPWKVPAWLASAKPRAHFGLRNARELGRGLD
jgi:hypothetical protein